jgi:hypothetical protein
MHPNDLQDNFLWQEENGEKSFFPQFSSCQLSKKIIKKIARFFVLYSSRVPNNIGGC